jgi:hypothetical protein
VLAYKKGCDRIQDIKKLEYDTYGDVILIIILSANGVTILIMARR